MDTKKIEKLDELLKNEEFMMELKRMDTLEELRSALVAKGIDVAAEELEAIAEEYARQTGEGVEELSEEQMENIAGGGAVAIGLFAFGVAQLAGLARKKLKSSSKKTTKKKNR